MKNDAEQLKQSLKKYWGYDDFRHPQLEIIQSILAGKDCLVIMPTGGGKSLCFQLPALLTDGLTLVISPLVALMENQVVELKEKNLPATILHSELSKQEKKQTLNHLQAQKYRLLYLSPETLLSPPIWHIMSQSRIKINALILDEAHCLAQWGDSFRPAYRRLATIRTSLIRLKPPHTKIPFACFTATADEQSQETIIHALQLKQPQQFLINPYRDNLQIKVKTIWTPKGRKKELLQFMQTKQEKSGLIYVRTRKESQQLAHILSQEGYPNYAYHAGLSAQKRRQIEQDWLAEKIKFVVCTSAFGMGINKSNLRWIFHYQAPLLLAEYIQEIGRAGRDGKLSEAFALMSEASGWLNPEDKQRRNYFLGQQIKIYRSAQQFVTQIPARGNIKQLFSQDDRQIQLYLAVLHSCQQLQWLDPDNYQLTLNQPQKAIQGLIIRQKRLTQQTYKYLTSKNCRWHFLLWAFNFSPPQQFRCGKCDNCLGKI
jgi:ATP-dependent DNA helicase RecQ